MMRVARIVALLACLVAPAFAADAQPASRPARIGFLPLGSPSNAYDQSLVEAFRQGLREAGLVENKQILLDVVWVGGEVEAARAVGELTGLVQSLTRPGGNATGFSDMLADLSGKYVRSGSR
jgi:putative tryptophan/tyrosine transport system substrate-binding protein